jgi:hypothetical protein
LCTEDVLNNSHYDLSFAHLRDGSVLIGTADDYTVYDRGLATPAVVCELSVPPGTSADACSAMAHDQDANAGLMLGTNAGLYGCLLTINRTSDPPTCSHDCSADFSGVFPASGDAISALVFDDGGTPNDGSLPSMWLDDVMWIGSRGQGIAVSDYRDNAIYTLMDDPSVWNAMPSKSVTALAYDREGGRLYIGTSDAGLMRVDVTHNAATATPVWGFSQWSYLTTPALPSGNVRALAIDTDRRVLWIGTAAGLVRATLEPVD